MEPNPPRVRLGALSDDGIAPALAALVEAGLARDARGARGIRGAVEFRFAELLDPSHVVFEEDLVIVSDGPAEAPHVVIEGRLTDVVRLTVTPTVGGVPHPLTAEGRGALRRIVRGEVRISGDRALGRRLLALLRRDA